MGHLLVDRKKRGNHKAEIGRLLTILAATLQELAVVDGHYKTSENKIILEILETLNTQTGGIYSLYELNRMIEESTRLQHPLQHLAKLAQHHQGLGHYALNALWRVAVCDCSPHPSELALIDNFSQASGATPDMVEYMHLIYTRQTGTQEERTTAYKFLGLSPMANATQVKSAYRSLSQTYHPDKHHNLDPAIKALTTEKFTQIKNAYEVLMGSGALELYVLAEQTHKLEPAQNFGGKVVHCFACPTRVRLPNADNIHSARCPVCQVLLAFEYSVAVGLTNNSPH